MKEQDLRGFGPKNNGYNSDDVKITYEHPLGKIEIPEGNFKFFILDVTKDRQEHFDETHKCHLLLEKAILDYKYLTSKNLVDSGIKPYGFSLDLTEAMINFYLNEFEKWKEESSIFLLGLENMVRIDERNGDKVTLIKSQAEFDEYYIKRQMGLIRGTISEDKFFRWASDYSKFFKDCLELAVKDFKKIVVTRGYNLISQNSGSLITTPFTAELLEDMEKKGFYGLFNLEKRVEERFSREDKSFIRV